MKNTTKKKVIHALSTGLKITAVGAVGLAFMGCPPEQTETAETRIETITLSFGTAKVKATLLRSEMDALKGGLTLAFDGAYSGGNILDKTSLENVFGRVGGVTIEVGNRPSNGNTYETVTGSNTLYLNTGALGNANLQAKLRSAVNSMGTDGSEIAMNKNRIRYASGMSPFELAKFQKHGNVRNS